AHTAFSEEIGCDLACDVDAGTATVRGDDPLAREVARRVLRQIVNRSIHAPDRIRSIAKQVKGEVDREVQNAGRKAIRMLGIQRVHPDIMHLVGRLKYRLSYSQNQLKHAIEVAYISGMIANELGLDAGQARRGGLLHDIGKAMTHDHEGSHAVLGAEVARQCGEEEIIANAIGAHHYDERPLGPIAYIVAAADAISGARPGARRESVTNYVRRIQDIQEIASRSPAVRRVDVMRAGREVRVIVAGAELGAINESETSGGPLLRNDELQPLALDIVRDLEEELTFAGQIRVTVIRESRAVSIAS
ncbi:MAG: HDIG domain-containing metalloprotein, partial [Myxococcota bacterium]